ncbi:hypothetical protein IP88_00775 [alpha proteobacterium AAP81b]|nr:hypothetical protein IP88_00775 [alpha proteobacterium AAP81b]
MAATDRLAKPARRATAAPALLFGTLALATLPTSAAAVSPFDIRFESEKPGIQTTTATFNTGGVMTFDSLATGKNQSFTTDFGTGGIITGKYKGVDIYNADQYGGAGGTGKYAATFTNAGYTLDLASTAKGGVNYFGYWLSALDWGNSVTFYTKGKAFFTFNPQDVRDALDKTGNAASYFGNPNAGFRGQNRGEPYVFVNFFLDTGSFDRIVFAENPLRGGYESDNHTVGNFKTKGTGTQVVVSEVPEPAIWATLTMGFVMVGAARRRPLSTAA